jgi:hypothetical protein
VADTLTQTQMQGRDKLYCIPVSHGLLRAAIAVNQVNQQQLQQQLSAGNIQPSDISLFGANFTVVDSGNDCTKITSTTGFKLPRSFDDKISGNVCIALPSKSVGYGASVQLPKMLVDVVYRQKNSSDNFTLGFDNKSASDMVIPSDISGSISFRKSGSNLGVKFWIANCDKKLLESRKITVLDEEGDPVPMTNRMIFRSGYRIIISGHEYIFFSRNSNELRVFYPDTPDREALPLYLENMIQTGQSVKLIPATTTTVGCDIEKGTTYPAEVLSHILKDLRKVNNYQPPELKIGAIAMGDGLNLTAISTGVQSTVLQILGIHTFLVEKAHSNYSDVFLRFGVVISNDSFLMPSQDKYETDTVRFTPKTNYLNDCVVDESTCVYADKVQAGLKGATFENGKTPTERPVLAMDHRTYVAIFKFLKTLVPPFDFASYVKMYDTKATTGIYKDTMVDMSVYGMTETGIEHFYHNILGQLDSLISLPEEVKSTVTELIAVPDLNQVNLRGILTTLTEKSFESHL